MKVDSLSFKGYAKINGSEKQVIDIISRLKTSNWFVRLYKPELDVFSKKQYYIIFSNGDIEKKQSLMKKYLLSNSDYSIFSELSNSLKLRFHKVFPALNKPKIFNLDKQVDVDNVVQILNN